MNILFTVSEMEGLIKTGGLADVGRYLPQNLNELNRDSSSVTDTRVILPYYRAIQDKAPTENTYSFSLFSHKEYQVRVHQITAMNLCVYAVDIPELFDREGIYSDNYHAYDDNGERFAVFSLAVLEFIRLFHEQLNFLPNIIHCNDWHTSLLPTLFKHSQFWQQQQTKTVLTIHNGAFQGIFAKQSVPTLLNAVGYDHPDYEDDVVNFLKLGIIDTHGLTAVSPNYAQELLTELGSHHLFDIFNQNRNKMIGILNGCDYQDWSPETDHYISKNYNIDSLSNKRINKLAIQEFTGMAQSADIPVIAMVSRLTDQKGLNYLLPAIKQFAHHRVQFLIAGTGDPIYVDQLEYLAKKYPNTLHFYHGFSEEIVHTYMAGADFFMMPSLFEPCGLTQMYALAYGTLPIVREVGGLKDTVIDLQHENSTGVVFKEPNSEHLVSAVRNGLLSYYESADNFNEIRKRAMQSKFLWSDSAKEFVGMYQTLLS